MNILELVIRQLLWQFARVIDLALQNWAITMTVLIAAIYWAGKQRRLNRHHL